jgi:hypothetical protein
MTAAPGLTPLQPRIESEVISPAAFYRVNQGASAGVSRRIGRFEEFFHALIFVNVGRGGRIDEEQ